MDKISPLILAAGSLHLAMDEITLAHQAQGGATFKTKYGPELNLSADNMLQVLSRPSVRVATSTPVSDPMGDYTWQFFKNADRKHAGFYQMLDAKARKLSGASVPATGERLPYITAFEDDKADAYMLYCTNAMITKKALPYLNVVRISDELNVRSDYGIAADLHWAVGKNFVRFIMQAPAQNILKKHGFD